MDYIWEMYMAEGSSNVQSYGYWEEEKKLRVIFRGSGPDESRTYEYLAVPAAIWHQLRAVVSKGSFLTNTVIPRFQCIRLAGALPIVPAKKAGDVETTLLLLQRALRRSSPQTHFLYLLWLMCGSPNRMRPDSPQGKLLDACKACIGRASGSNTIGAEHLPKAIALAAEEGL